MQTETRPQGPGDGAPSRPHGVARTGLALLALAAVYTVYTWLCFRPSLEDFLTALAPDVGDPRFNLVILKWGLHQIPRGFAEFWNAPFFHPVRGVTALSDHMIGPILQAYVFTRFLPNAIAAYNALFLTSFVLSGLTTAYVLRRMGISWLGAGLGGAFFAFSPFRMWHLSHLQLLLVQWVPLLLWLFDRMLQEPRWRRSLIFLAVYALHVSGGTYLAYMVHFAFGVLALNRLGRLKEHLRDPSARMILGLTGAGCAAILLPVFLPYLVLGDDLGIERNPGSWRTFGTTLISYLTPGLFYRFREPWMGSWMRPENSLFAGLIATALTAFGLWLFFQARRRSPETTTGAATPKQRWILRGLGLAALTAWMAAELRTWTAFGAFRAWDGPLVPYSYRPLFWVLLLSLGAWLILSKRWRGRWPWALPAADPWSRGMLWVAIVCAAISFPILYNPLAEVLPGMDGMRAIPRFHAITSFALTIFAAVGFDALRRKIPGRGARALVVGGIFAFCAWELSPKPISWNRLPQESEIDEVYRWIQDNDEIEALVELLICKPPRDTRYMYFQTFHWKPLVNGFSGSFPEPYRDLKEICCFPVPDDAGLAALREMGVSHIVLHKHRKRWKRWQRKRIHAFVARPDIEEVYAKPWVWVFKILPTDETPVTPTVTY